MKKIVFKCALLLATVSMASCGDLLESSNNGKLDGWWHLVSIDTLATEGHLNLSSGRKMVAFQGNILEMQDADGGSRLMFRFVMKDNQLSLSDARYNDRTQGDPLVEYVEVLRPFGVNNLNETFKVEHLSGSKMTLVSSTLRLRYNKY